LTNTSCWQIRRHLLSLVAKIMRSRRPYDPWSRLAAVVRAESNDEEYVFVPYGFSAEVVAIAFRRRSPAVAHLTAAYAGRALAIAWLLAIWSLLQNCDPLIDFILQAG
jgi:hypothetical protein